MESEVSPLGVVHSFTHPDNKKAAWLCVWRTCMKDWVQCVGWYTRAKQEQTGQPGKHLPVGERVRTVRSDAIISLQLFILLGLFLIQDVSIVLPVI